MSVVLNARRNTFSDPSYETTRENNVKNQINVILYLITLHVHTHTHIYGQRNNTHAHTYILLYIHLVAVFPLRYTLYIHIYIIYTYVYRAVLYRVRRNIVHPKGLSFFISFVHDFSFQRHVSSILVCVYVYMNERVNVCYP